MMRLSLRIIADCSSHATPTLAEGSLHNAVALTEGLATQQLVVHIEPLRQGQRARPTHGRGHFVTAASWNSRKRQIALAAHRHQRLLLVFVDLVVMDLRVHFFYCQARQGKNRCIFFESFKKEAWLAPNVRSAPAQSQSLHRLLLAHTVISRLVAVAFNGMQWRPWTERPAGPAACSVGVSGLTLSCLAMSRKRGFWAITTKHGPGSCLILRWPRCRRHNHGRPQSASCGNGLPSSKTCACIRPFKSATRLRSCLNPFETRPSRACSLGKVHTSS